MRVLRHNRPVFGVRIGARGVIVNITEDWGQALDGGGAHFNVPEDIASEALQIGVMTCHPDSTKKDWFPGMRVHLNEQPIVILQQITREQFTERVHAAGVGTDWLNCPPDTQFWLISSD